MNHSQSWPTILSKGNSCSMILKELIPHWFQRMLAALNAKNTNLNHTTENYCARLQFNLACGWYGSRNLGMFLPSSDFQGHTFSLGPSSWLCHSALTTLGAHRSHIWHRGDLPQLGSSQRAVNLNISITADCQTPTGSTGWAVTLPGLRKGRSPVQEHRVTLRCCRGFHIYTKNFYRLIVSFNRAVSGYFRPCLAYTNVFWQNLGSHFLLF